MEVLRYRGYLGIRGLDILRSDLGVPEIRKGRIWGVLTDFVSTVGQRSKCAILGWSKKGQNPGFQGFGGVRRGLGGLGRPQMSPYP